MSGHGQPVHPEDPAVRAFHLHQAHVLRLSSFAVKRQLEAGMTLRAKPPATWAVLLQGGCSQHVAGIAADQIQGLNDAQVAAMDLLAAELVQQERAGAVERELVRLRERLEPEATIGRHRSASNRRWVGARPRPDGQATLTIETSAVDVAAMYDAIRQSAVAAHGGRGRVPHAGPADGGLRRRHGPAGGPGRRGRPGRSGVPDGAHRRRQGPGAHEGRRDPAGHVPADVVTGAADGTATVAGMGSVDSEVALRLVQHTATWTRVLVDPVEDVVLGTDSHERSIPAGLKKPIHARNGTCSAEGCGIPAHCADLDHATRVEHDGRSHHDNLQALCRRHHQDKDGGYHDVTLRPDGTPRWASRWGAVWNPRPSLRIRTDSSFDEPPF